MSKTRKDGFSLIGLGVAACVACCAGPILAFVGGLSIVGIAGSWLIGGAGLIVAAAAAAVFVLVRSWRQSSCAVAAADPVPVELTTREGAAR